MNTRKLVAVATVAFMAMVASADLYVDAAADPASADGTAEHPYATIQAAVNVASAGTTIRIAEGVYDQGGVDEGNGVSSRVKIDYKNVHIIGAGRGKTIVVGGAAPTEDGRGSGACRCIFADWAHGTVIEGVTLKGGSSLAPTSSIWDSECGGGLLVKGGKSGSTSSDPNEVYLVDSEIVDCRAGYGGGAKGGTLVRSLVDGCMANQGLAAYKSRLVNCVVTRSRPLHTYNTDGVVYESTVVNCTIVDNAAKTAVANYSNVANSLVTISSSYLEKTADTTDSSGNVFSLSAPGGRVQLLAPAVGDWRLLDSSDAVDAASYSALTSLAFPEGVDPLKDFAGNAIVSNGGQINAGALQEAVAPAAGGLFFRYSENGTSVVVADGYTNVFDSATWIFPEVYPTQYVFAAAAKGEGMALCRLARFSGAYVNAQLGFAPRLDDTVCLLPPPTPGVVMTNYFDFATSDHVRWVDAENGSDGNPGTEAEPYETLKAALESFGGISSGAFVIYAKKGVYDKEAMDAPTTLTAGKFRLVADAGEYGRLRIVAVDGPEETFIVGAPNTSESAGTVAGCGGDAVRGVLLVGKSDVSLQGFTIAGCYSGITYDSRKSGAAVFSDAGAKRAQITDCIISNNYALASIVHGGLMKRCKIIGNTSEETILNHKDNIAVSRTSTMAAFCLFAGNMLVNPSAEQGLIGGKSVAYNCTIVGATDAGRVTSGKAGYSQSTIYYGGETVYGAETMANCVVWGCADTSAISGENKVENPVFVSRRSGDYRVGNRSPCAGYAATVDAHDFWQVFDGAMDGALAFRNGRAVVGAYQRTAMVDPMGLFLLLR